MKRDVSVPPPDAGPGAVFSWFAGLRERDSQLYARLSRLAGADPDLLAPVQPLPSGSNMPLLFFAAVHHVVLDGARHPLADIFRAPGRELPSDAVLADGLASFLTTYAAEVRELMATRAVQTNEVNRSALITPAMRVARELAGTELALVEVGASAGLNLHFDRYMTYYTHRSRPTVHVSGPPTAAVQLKCELLGDLVPPLGGGVHPEPGLGPALRMGLDLAPVSVHDDTEMSWLHACIFPDQPERAARARAATAVARAHPVPIHAGDVLEVLPKLLSGVPRHLTPVVMHTWVLAYLSDRQRADFAALLADQSRDRRVLWLGAEWPQYLPGRPAQPDDEGTVWSLAVLDGGEAQHHTLASAHEHATWANWRHKTSIE